MPISSNPQNFRIVQDKKGYVYIANGAGILIFDGNDWQVLSNGNEQVYFDLALSDDGRIYTGTLGDLGYFEANAKGEWAFRSLIVDEKTPEFTYIIQVHIEGEHIIYLTPSYIFHYHPSTGLTWVKEKIATSFMKSDGNNILISSYTQSLLSYSLVDKKIIELEDYYIEDAPFIAGMLDLENSQRLIYSREKLYLKKGDLIRNFKTEIDAWLGENRIMDVQQLSNKNIIIASRFSGLAIINEEGKLIRFYNKSHGLKDNRTAQVMVDKSDNVWITHDSNGISRVELNSSITQYSDEENFTLNSSTIEFKNNVFIGAIDGLFKLEQSSDLEQQANFKKASSQLEAVFSFLEDNDELLIGHYFGIHSLQIDDEKKIKISSVHDASKSKGNYVRAMIRSSEAAEIIYAISADGLIKLIKNKGSWISEGLLPGLSEDLFSIHQDSEYNLWLGSVKGEFYKISELGGWPSVKINPIDFLETEEFSPAMSFKLNSNSLFTNSMVDGIYMLDAGGAKFELSELAAWKHNNVSHFEVFFQNLKGEAWFASKDKNSGRNRVGLLKPVKQGLYGIDFSALDRLNLEFVNGLYASKNNTLWVNARGRIIRFDSSQPQKKQVLGTPVLTRVDELGSSQKLWLNTSFDSTHPGIRLLAPENSIRIHFSAVNYQNNSTLEYRYRLKGLLKKWSSWNSRPFVEYTNLKPGNFTFELQYRTNINYLSEILEVNISHNPYWYQYVWMKFLMALFLLMSFISVAIIVSRFKSRKLMLQAIELEKQVFERTEIIAKQNKKLYEMDEAKNRFFANVSHEFRTPLTLAIGPLKELVASKHINDRQDRECLHMALKNSLHMMELLGQVLDINRLESGDMPLKIIKLNLVKNLQYCIDRFHFLAKKQQVSFNTIGFEDNLDIYFDADHFEKIVLNLISNAIKYSSSNSCIEVGLRRKNSKVEFWIQDEGTGINCEDKAHVFDRFYQGQTSPHTIQPGTGIGLALVKELLDLHQGIISLETELSKGTKFTVTLLLGKEHYDSALIANNSIESKRQQNLSEAIKEPDSSTNDHVEIDSEYRKTLLIVDDNEELRRFIRIILHSSYTIIEADNGRSALQLAIDNQPDLILCDIMMPIMDGIELSRKLRESKATAHIPLILLTAKSSKRDIVEGLQQGADDYLSKPFDSSELIARIAAQIAQKQRIADKLFSKFSLQEPSSSDESDDFPSHLNELISGSLGNHEFGVELMCEKMNASRSTLFRQVKKHFDCTPKQLLKQRRLNLALRMLKSGSGSVSEVAYAVGFKSLSSFSHAFSDEYKTPPTRVEDISILASS